MGQQATSAWAPTTSTTRRSWADGHDEDDPTRVSTAESVQGEPLHKSPCGPVQTAGPTRPLPRLVHSPSDTTSCRLTDEPLVAQVTPQLASHCLAAIEQRANSRAGVDRESEYDWARHPARAEGRDRVDPSANEQSRDAPSGALLIDANLRYTCLTRGRRHRLTEEDRSTVTR